jgi:hypothetical protein
MWVYGGSFVAGSAATYDPRILMGLAQKTVSFHFYVLVSLAN